MGRSEAWSPEYNPDVLSRLLELWKDSQLPDVKYVASWALSALPLMDRELKPLLEPDSDSIKFVEEQFLMGEGSRKLAALVIGFYWKKPWTDEELAKKVKDADLKERNKSLILKALKSGKRKAHSA